ncbi:MAG: hypothetical protein M1819_003668 [Sarea resinae]|nr:MAG: hypothetical protein M1819_003668 [Sarea resinae]
MPNAIYAEPVGPVNLLALDGGGIRGISELLILDEIMRRIQCDQNLPELPKPCDYFDLIGGASTGGYWQPRPYSNCTDSKHSLIAIMLGRLRMSTREALAQYSLVAARVFSKQNRKWRIQDGTFKATTLEREIRRIVTESLGRSRKDARMLDESSTEERGKTAVASVVCAIPASNMAFPTLFRTYEVRANMSDDCKIWEAARATTAAPTFFKRVVIGEPGQVKTEYVDAALGCNNPTEHVIREALEIFVGERPVGVVVSIGAGHPGVIGLSEPHGYQRILPLKLIDVLKRIAIDCNDTADRLARRFRRVPGIYFRLNVNHGISQISLDEWKKIGHVKDHTTAYMHDLEVSQAIDSITRRLCNTDSEPLVRPISLADMLTI